MGQCCQGAGGDDSKEKDEKFASGGAKDLSCGPVKERGCTDIVWIPIFIAAQVIFLIVTVAGMTDGNPAKLYAPRDFMGAYCGVETNWNDGPNLAATPMLSFTMNVSSTVELLMQQTVCSTVAMKALVEGDSSTNTAALLTTQAEKDQYLCDCCLAPCGTCEGSIDVVDFTDPAVLQNIMTAKLSELTQFDATSVESLFSTSGANSEMFSTATFWTEATKWFNTVCVTDCATDYTTIASADDSRIFNYTPPMDDKLYGVWNTLSNADSSNSLASAAKSVMNAAFKFEALPFSACPYDAQYCVPFPGVKFADLSGSTDYCTFEFASEVLESVGNTVAGSLQSLGITAFGEASIEEFGKWVGDFQKTLDTFIVVSILSFVIGLLFLIILRFTIGICVWIAIFLTVVMFFFGGAFIFVLSIQCSGAGILETGQQTVVASAVAASTAISDAATGIEASEDCTGDCSDYRGRQHYTKNGYSCVSWDTPARAADRMPQYTSTNYAGAGLAIEGNMEINNYCRNPYDNNSTLKHDTIWCVTSDPNVKWEECLPIGVIIPECDAGHAIEAQEMRDALYYSSFVIWALGVIWLIVILCFVKRINLAIALNKVAAVFLASNPHVLLIPIVQALVAIIWTVLWMFCASFLLSQVPDTYTPSGYYATYAEAYGTAGDCTTWDTIVGNECTAGVPGACTDQWPTGAVWKTNACEEVGDVVKCWRCSQPRYALDVRFAVSFFVFLWNNAFNVAMGQILIAMAVGVWFFRPKNVSSNEEEEGKGSFSTSIVPNAVKTIFRYHVGSVAFGSFIVAVVEFIRYLMKYFEKQAEAQKNKIMVLVFKCVGCCIWCFEKCIKFLNKNAYIQIALLGKSFCTSAKEAFFLIGRNVLRFGTIAALSGIVHSIGFVCIMSATTVIGFFLVGEMHPDISAFMPCICFILVSYVVAKLFMNVFGLAVDTSLQCFIAAEEMNNVGDFIPDSLKSFVASQSSKDSKEGY